MKRNCETCGAEFGICASKAASRRGAFCSVPCRRSRRPRKPIADRLWPKVDRNGPVHPVLGTRCWLWTGGRCGGYGAIRQTPTEGDAHVLAHRVSWELHNGPIPSGMEVCHHCDEPVCVSPTHLFLGTHADNMADMVRKGRAGGGRLFGERGPAAALTDAQTTEIRDALSNGARVVAIAKRYRVNPATVHAIRDGRIFSTVSTTQEV